MATVLLPVILLSVPLIALPLEGLLAFAYQDVSPWTLPRSLSRRSPLIVCIGLNQDERRLAEGWGLLISDSSAQIYLRRRSGRDPPRFRLYTAGHSAAVAIYARDIAARIGLSEEERQPAHLCGLVHDIGKIGLPPGLSRSGGADAGRAPADAADAVIGERILAKVEDYSEIATIVCYYHEKWTAWGTRTESQAMKSR